MGSGIASRNEPLLSLHRFSKNRFLLYVNALKIVRSFKNRRISVNGSRHCSSTLFRRQAKGDFEDRSFVGCTYYVAFLTCMTKK